MTLLKIQEIESKKQVKKVCAWCFVPFKGLGVSGCFCSQHCKKDWLEFIAESNENILPIDDSQNEME